MDSNFFCSVQRKQSRVYARFCEGKDLSCFHFSFLGVSFSFNFNEPKKEGRVLGIQVVGFMSSHDKGSLDGIFVFKESKKNLIHSVSELLDLCLATTRDFLMVFSCLRSQEIT